MERRIEAMSKYIFAFIGLSQLALGFFKDLPPDKDYLRLIFATIGMVGWAILDRIDEIQAKKPNNLTTRD